MAPISDFSIESILADDHSVTSESPEATDKRPEVTYSALIFMAIRSSSRKLLTLNEICQWIEANFPYYRNNKETWQNSVRHTLSVNENFVKVPRPMDDPGRGCYWSLHPQAETLTVGESTGRLRNIDQSVSANVHPYQHPSPSNWCPQQLFDPSTQTWYSPSFEELQWAAFYSGK